MTRKLLTSIFGIGAVATGIYAMQGHVWIDISSAFVIMDSPHYPDGYALGYGLGPGKQIVVERISEYAILSDGSALGTTTDGKWFDVQSTGETKTTTVRSEWERRAGPSARGAQFRRVNRFEDQTVRLASIMAVACILALLITVTVSRRRNGARRRNRGFPVTTEP